MILGLVGRAQVGKDSIANLLVRDFGFERIAFADALRAVAFDSSPEYGIAVSKYGYEAAKANVPFVRQYLQDLGSAVRLHLGVDTWVDATLGIIERNPAVDYVITDVRYPNEAAGIRSLGGFTVRVTRPDAAVVRAHESESALDSWAADFGITNDGNLDDLEDKATEMLCAAILRTMREKS